jgi:hypothetical protein
MATGGPLVPLVKYNDAAASKVVLMTTTAQR